MKIRIAVILGITIIFTCNLLHAQDYEEYSIEEVYERVDLDNGTLDEDGNNIRFIFVKTKLDKGTYEIEITDGPGDLYQIKGTDIFVEFRGYYGYAGYGDEGILKVHSGYYMPTFYKIE